MTTLKTYYSCGELAEMQLGGFPITKKGWIDLVARENWIKQQRIGRGGGYEYQPPARIKKLIESKLKIQYEGTEAKALLEIRSKLRIEAEQARASCLKSVN